MSKDGVGWLLKNAGSVICYRAATELLKGSNRREVEGLREALFSDGLVQFWLGNLRPDFSRNVMHSGKSEGYENVIGKLCEFGLRKGMRVLDERTAPLRRWLDELPARARFILVLVDIVSIPQSS